MSNPASPTERLLQGATEDEDVAEEKEELVEKEVVAIVHVLDLLDQEEDADEDKVDVVDAPKTALANIATTIKLLVR